MLSRPAFLTALAIALLILAAWGYWAFHAPLLAGWAVGNRDTVSAGQWGDSFGAFNALFGALGFSAVLGTLLLQARALKHQQNDQHRQRFESSFFQLLTLMRELRREISYRYSTDYREANASRKLGLTSTKEGLQAIGIAVSALRFWINQQRREGKTLDAEDISKIYTYRVHRRFESQFGPYFRIIYTMLYRIRKDSVLTDEEKNRYGNLLRSQLTSQEVFLTAVNGLSPFSKDLADHITHFRLLKYLPEGSRRRTLVGAYPPEAFAARD